MRPPGIRPPPSHLPPPRRCHRCRHLSLNPSPPSRPLPPYESYRSHHPNFRWRRFLFPRIEACMDPNISSPAPLSLPYIIRLPSLSLYWDIWDARLYGLLGGVELPSRPLCCRFCCRIWLPYWPHLLFPLGIVCLIVVVAVLGAHVIVVPALLSGGWRSSSHGVLRRRSIVCGIDKNFVVVCLCDFF